MAREKTAHITSQQAINRSSAVRLAPVSKWKPVVSRLDSVGGRAVAKRDQSSSKIDDTNASAIASLLTFRCKNEWPQSVGGKYIISLSVATVMMTLLLGVSRRVAIAKITNPIVRQKP